MQSYNGNSPYISVVVAARNDDYGGNLLMRMQVFMDAWISLAKRHNLASELIIVEWNPPADRDRLVTALRWPGDTEPCQVRIIEVPPEVHRRYQYAADLPLYPLIAKNAGIRRARGEFVLATNIDIVFSDELVQFLASRRLESGRMYRIDRHDVMSDIPVHRALDEQLTYCRKHVIQVLTREGVYRLTPEGLRRNQPEDITLEESGIHFGTGWFPVEWTQEGAFRWIDDDAQLLVRVPPGGAVLALEVEPGPGIAELPQALEVLDENRSKVAEWSIAGRTSMELIVPPAVRGGIRRFWLHVPGGGLPTIDDLRIQNFRVFRCDWVGQRGGSARSTRWMLRDGWPTLKRQLFEIKASEGFRSLLTNGPGVFNRSVQLLRSRGSDIFEAGAEYHAGKGWHDWEQAGGETFRWVSNDAELVIRSTSENRSLALLVEPGPGVGSRPFVLLIRRPDGTVISRAKISGVTYVEIPVPVSRGSIVKLFLTPEGGGVATKGDPRILNFRVFACGGGSGKDTLASGTEAGDDQCWTALTIASQPPTEALNPRAEEKRQIADMGKAAFLHTHGCGDFTLMARARWFDVRGYPELDLVSTHLDTLLCHSAHHAGLQQEILREPMRMYHIEHQDRPDLPGVPSLSYKELVWLVGQMRIFHAPLIFNLDDWGLAEVTLSETAPTIATDNAGIGR